MKWGGGAREGLLLTTGGSKRVGSRRRLEIIPRRSASAQHKAETGFELIGNNL